MKAPLEGILYLCGDEGISKEDILKVLDINKNELESLISELKNDYQNQDRGIMLEIFGDICKLVTKKEHSNIYSKLIEVDINRPLTQSSLEVLAIIAYNQPITRIKIDEIRGINSSHMLRKLSLKGLIYEYDRAELPGRPILYKTTSKFLDCLGICELDDLPDIEKVEEDLSETELFSKKEPESV